MFLIRMLFFVLAFLSCATLLQAQKSHVRFVLLNQKTNTPIADASVYSDDYSLATVSNEVGVVEIANLPTAITHINISCIGYTSIRVAVAGIPAQLLLQPVVSSLADVTVNAGARKGVFKTISDLDVHVRPIANSQEVLRMVPGLFIGQHAGGGKAEQIFLRGFDIDHGTDIQINVDGMPVNMVSHAHGQGYADLHFVIPELIQKVDFNKGPYFADKGNFATAGYVDFKTKDYLEQSFVKLEAGQFDTWRAVTAVNLLKPGSANSLYLAGEASFTKGFFESPQDFRRLNGLLKYHGSVSKHTSVTALVSAFTSKWNASGQIPDRAVATGDIGWFGAIDNTEGGSTSRYNASVEFNTYLSSGWQLQQQWYYSRYNFDLFSNFTFFLDNPIDGDQIRQKEKRDITGGKASISKSHYWGKTPAKFTAGIQARYDATNESALLSTKQRYTVLSEKMLGDVGETNLAFYGEDKLSLLPSLDLTLGVRGDYFHNKYNDKLAQQTLTSSSFILSPKLNLNWKVNKQVQLYLYNGQGFHSNDTRVAVQQNGREVVTPAWGTDLGAVIKLGKKAMLQTALWHLWMQQEFVYVGDAGVVEPGGKSRRYGADVSIRYEIIRYLYADVDVNITKPIAIGEPKGANYLPLAPRFSSTGGITYRKASGINGSLRYRWMGNRPANEDNSVVAKGYFVTDAAINYTANKWEAGLAIQNLFNVKWKETQFDTESRLQNEPNPVSEIHFTPGAPFFARISCSYFF